MPDVVVYDPSIDTDKKKLFACYSILEQMRLEHNTKAGNFRSRLTLEPVPIDQEQYEAKRKAGFIRPWCPPGFMLQDTAPNNDLRGKYHSYALESKRLFKQVFREYNRVKKLVREAAYTKEQWRQIERLDDEERDAAYLSVYGDKAAEKVKPTLATSPALTQLAALNVDHFPVLGSDDPTEDIQNDYVEYEETFDQLSISGGTITASNAYNRYATKYVYGNKGSGHFSGDFSHRFEAQQTETSSCSFTVWALSNTPAKDWYYHLTNNLDYIGMSCYYSATYPYRCAIHEQDGEDSYIDYDTPVWNQGVLYIEIERDGTDFDAWEATSDYYSDGGDLEAAQSLELQGGAKAYQYIYAHQSFDNGGASTYQWSGYLTDLDLQEGGTTHEASATLSGAATLSADSHITAIGAATLAGAGSLAATGGLVHQGTATMGGAGSLAAAGVLIKYGAATTSGAGSLTAAGTVIEAEVVYGSAAITGSGSLAATAAVTHTGAATLTGSGALTGASLVTRHGAATLSGAGSLAAIAQLFKHAAAALAGSGSLAGLAHKTAHATAALSGAGALSAAGVLLLLASATLSGSGSLSAAGSIPSEVTGSATISGEGSLSCLAYSYAMSSTLLAAQQALHHVPYVDAKLYPLERGIKRLTWTRHYTGGEADNHHGIAFDGEGSMHRLMAGSDDKLYRQKVTNPGPGSNFGMWQQIAADCAGPCAIAACGAKIYIFYKKTDDTLRKYYSHNYGSSWTNEELSTYAGVASMAAAWWGTSNDVTCFALKSNQINGITVDTSDQSQDTKTWSDGTHPWTATYGLGATYNPFWPGIEIVVAAKESDTPYSHYNLHRTKFSNTHNFLALESFLMAPDGEDITYEYPDCHLPASAQEYETTRVLAVEKYAGVTAYTRPIACHLVKGTYWSDTTLTEPRPFMDIAPAYGLRMQSTAGYWWISTPSGVWSAPRLLVYPLNVLDLTPRIIAAQHNKPGTLTLELNNSDGYFTFPGHAPIDLLTFRAELQLRLGYRTPAGAEWKDAGTYWVDSWEYSPKTSQSTLIITALDGWGLLQRWTARYHMRWNKDEVGPRSVWQILYQVLARVGIRLTNTPPKPKSSAIDNFYPDFAIAPGTQGTQALNKLLSFVPDHLVFRGQEAFTKNPLATEDSVYPYGKPHRILDGRYAHKVTPSRSRALGRETDGDRVLQETIDWEALDLSIDILDQDYDPNLQTATRAQERADAISRKNQISALDAAITIPPNVIQELLDVVTVTDVRCALAAADYRVLALRTDYDRRNGRYTQRLTLGAP